jgi:type III secretory pathway component EscV
MSQKIRKHSDLLVLVACYLAPLFYSWSYSPILTAVTGGLILTGFIAVIYVEEPTQASWFPQVTVVLLCFKAFVLSMMAVPGWPAFSMTSSLCYLGYIFVAYLIIWNSGERISQVAARFSLDAAPGKMLAIDADLRAGNIEPSSAEAKRNRVLQEGRFYERCDGLGWCLRYEVVGTLCTLLILGITEPEYIVGHLFLSLLVSINLGMLVSRSACDSNLS